MPLANSPNYVSNQISPRKCISPFSKASTAPGPTDNPPVFKWIPKRRFCYDPSLSFFFLIRFDLATRRERKKLKKRKKLAGLRLSPASLPSSSSAGGDTTALYLIIIPSLTPGSLIMISLAAGIYRCNVLLSNINASMWFHANAILICLFFLLMRNRAA